MGKIKQNPFVQKVGFNRIVLCGVLLLLYGFFCVMTQGRFAGTTRILSALNYAYFLGHSCYWAGNKPDLPVMGSGEIVYTRTISPEPGKRQGCLYGGAYICNRLIA